MDISKSLSNLQYDHLDSNFYTAKLDCGSTLFLNRAGAHTGSLLLLSGSDNSN